MGKACFQNLLQLEHAHVQVIILSVVAFGALGIHNATSQGTDVAKATRVALSQNQVAYHAECAIFSFFLTPFACQVPIRKLAFCGALLSTLQGVNDILAYAFDFHHPATLVLLGLISALSNALLWVCIYGVVLGYATQQERGIYIAIVWSFIQVGSTVNAAVNAVTHRGARLACMVLLQTTGGLLAVMMTYLLIEPALVVKANGTYARTYQLCVMTSISAELSSVFRAATEIGVLLILPTTFVSVWTRPIEIIYIIGALTETIEIGNVGMTLYFATQALGVWLVPLLVSSRLTLPQVFVGKTIIGLVVQGIVRIQLYVAAMSSPEQEYESRPRSLSKLGLVYPLMAMAGLFDCLTSVLMLWIAGGCCEGHTRKCVRTGSLIQGIQSVGGIAAWNWIRHSTFTFEIHIAITIMLVLVSFPFGLLSCEILQTRDYQKAGAITGGAVAGDSPDRFMAGRLDSSESAASTNPSFFSLYVPK